MAFIRSTKTKNYSIVSNHILRNGNISLKAKGLLIYLLHLPDDWDISLKGLCLCLKEGKDAINHAIKELIEFKYITRKEKKRNNLKSGYDYYVFENPHE